jgi:hypothetical protein
VSGLTITSKSHQEIRCKHQKVRCHIMVIDPNRKLRGRIKWLGREVDVDYGVDAIPTLFIIDGRDNVIYGDVSIRPSNSSSRKSSASLTKQRRVPRMTGRNEFDMRLGGGDECEHQSVWAGT